MAEKNEVSKKFMTVEWSVLKDQISISKKSLKWPFGLVIIAVVVALIVNINFSSIYWNWQLILEYVDVLRWPVVALISIVIFKNQIPELIKKLKRAGWRDAYADFETQVIPQNQETEETLKNVVSENDTASDGTSTSRTQPSNSQPASDDELLADKDVQLLFERIHGDIFGTQLEALKLLRGYVNGLSENDLMPIYLQHTKIAPNPYPNVLAFMNYPASYSLVERGSDTGTYKITYAGTLFLEYLIRNNRINNFKPF